MGRWNCDRDCQPAELTAVCLLGWKLLARVPSTEPPLRLPFRGGVLIGGRNIGRRAPQPRRHHAPGATHASQHPRENARKVCVRRAGHKGISPLPVALVEGRRRAQWYPPGTTDSLGARKAKAAHQINPVVAQSKIGRRPVNGFYARNFDLRQGRGRCLGRRQCPRLLRMCCKRPCRSHAYK
jgi:hypothetical protein